MGGETVHLRYIMTGEGGGGSIKINPSFEHLFVSVGIQEG